MTPTHASKPNLIAMKLLLTLFLLLFLTTAHAQQFFQERVGGAGSESARAMVKTSDGGFVLAGSTYSYGQDSGDVYVVKMHNNGTIQWTKTIGGPSYDAASDIIQTNDDGYIITGRTGYWEFGIYVVKLNGSGNLQWSNKINSGLFDQGYSIIQTVDGGYAIAARGSGGGLSYPGLLIKLNSSGSIEWNTAHYGFTDGAYSLVQASDLSYVLAGMSSASGGNLLITKVDSTGAVAWSRSIGGPGAEMSGPGSKLIRTNDNGYAYIGWTNSYGSGGNDMYVIKLNFSGILLWSKAIGTPNDDYGNSIIQLADKSYIVTGTTYKANNTTDAYVAKLDSSGNLLWTDILGGNAFEEGNTAAQLNDGSLIIAGGTTSYGNAGEIYLVKLDDNGNTCGNYTSAGSSTTGGVSNTINYNTFPLNLTLVNGPAAVSSGGVMNTICSCTAPVSVITSSSLFICSGDSISLLTNATPGNTYKWLRNGNVVSGANASTYFTSTGGTYACVQSNACGNDTSNLVTITVKPLPSASISATSTTTICTGDSVQLNGVAAANRSYQWLRNGLNISGAYSATYFAKQSGKYRLIVTNTITGCTKSGNTVTVSAIALPPATVTALGPTTFCAGGNVTLQANSGAGLTYQWRKNGFPISGASSINYTATTAGKYKVDVTNTNGCVKKSSNVTINVPCREGETHDENKLSIYPNPSTGVFYIRIKNNQAEVPTIRIVDNAGREVTFQYEFSGQNITLDLSELENGIYHFFYNDGYIEEVNKLIKMF